MAPSQTKNIQQCRFELENLDVIEYVVSFLPHYSLDEIKLVNKTFKVTADNRIKTINPWKCNCNYCWRKIEFGNYDVASDVKEQKVYTTQKEIYNAIKHLLSLQSDMVGAEAQTRGVYDLFCLLCANYWFLKDYPNLNSVFQSKLSEFDTHHENRVRLMSSKIRSYLFPVV